LLDSLLQEGDIQHLVLVLKDMDMDTINEGWNWND